MTRLTIVVVTFIIPHVEGFDTDPVEITVGIEGGTHDQASCNEREWNMTVLLVILFPCCSPEAVILLRSRFKLLLDRHMIRTISKDIESV